MQIPIPGNSPKSKILLWILLAILIVGDVTAFYVLRCNKAECHDSSAFIDSEDPIVDEKKAVEERNVKGERTFLEQFYDNYNDENYLLQHITADVRNKLRCEYEYECPSDDCLATWVFLANSGSDMELLSGPFISKTDKVGKYKVDFKYGYLDNDEFFENNTVYLSVEDVDGQYMITDYEVVINKSINNPDYIATILVKKDIEKKSFFHLKIEYPMSGSQQAVTAIRKWIVTTLNNQIGDDYNGINDAEKMATYYSKRFMDEYKDDCVGCGCVISKEFENDRYVSYIATGSSGGASFHYWTKCFTYDKEANERVTVNKYIIGDKKDLFHTLYRYVPDLPLESDSKFVDAVLRPDSAICVITWMRGDWEVTVPVEVLKNYLSSEAEGLMEW